MFLERIIRFDLEAYRKQQKGIFHNEFSWINNKMKNVRGVLNLKTLYMRVIRVEPFFAKCRVMLSKAQFKINFVVLDLKPLLPLNQVSCLSRLFDAQKNYFPIKRLP
ncbi:MAG: hypothetical protein COA85_11550 [Robiginitomaculum sp.]|nr:MAG: hypothetical protein COA85_11550 [Robiginitomaculum sp.]